jgi:hypothetical protein
VPDPVRKKRMSVCAICKRASLFRLNNCRSRRKSIADGKDNQERHRRSATILEPREVRERLQRGDDVIAHQSMTSSGRTRRDGGTVRPSAFAVLRSITSSNLSAARQSRFASFEWAGFKTARREARQREQPGVS